MNVLMYDVQEDRDKYGYLCTLTYRPADDSLAVDSYSPYMDDYIYDDENPDAERFVLHNVFFGAPYYDPPVRDESTPEPTSPA